MGLQFTSADSTLSELGFQYRGPSFICERSKGRLFAIRRPTWKQLAREWGSWQAARAQGNRAVWAELAGGGRFQWGIVDGQLQPKEWGGVGGWLGIGQSWRLAGGGRFQWGIVDGQLQPKGMGQSWRSAQNRAELASTQGNRPESAPAQGNRIELESGSYAGGIRRSWRAAPLQWNGSELGWQPLQITLANNKNIIINQNKTLNFFL
ncbi:hypothetical protein AMTR_s00003p00269240 [Amborella trichopoda]|uniref:Uncharacterized protein n=1 Tax=Amborella trichopoda TaxID=13333 RepID=W1P7A7_AMBTC|nr:hypothetical protein AMTR_s00003p00269240 [Amborella trichopoda]